MFRGTECDCRLSDRAGIWPLVSGFSVTIEYMARTDDLQSTETLAATSFKTKVNGLTPKGETKFQLPFAYVLEKEDDAYGGATADYHRVAPS